VVAQARAKDVNSLAMVARRPKAEVANGQPAAAEAPAPEAS
jgi:hypothetical protein